MTESCLDLDVGNSRTKWRSGALSGSEIGARVPDLEVTPARIRISSVAGKHVNLTKEATEKYGVKPEFARTTRYLGGLTNGYREPSTLGVDRWLAIIAAYNIAQAGCIVVDAGTALTVDHVKSDGVHQGGYIVPGLNAQRQILKEQTVAVQVQAQHSPTLGLGRDTPSAVIGGSAQMVADWLGNECARFQASQGVAPIIFLTGGDAMQLAPALNTTFKHEPHLVLDGLAIALP